MSTSNTLPQHINKLSSFITLQLINGGCGPGSSLGKVENPALHRDHLDCFALQSFGCIQTSEVHAASIQHPMAVIGQVFS